MSAGSRSGAQSDWNAPPGLNAKMLFSKTSSSKLLSLCHSTADTFDEVGSGLKGKLSANVLLRTSSRAYGKPARRPNVCVRSARRLLRKTLFWMTTSPVPATGGVEPIWKPAIAPLAMTLSAITTRSASICAHPMTGLLLDDPFCRLPDITS